MEKAKNGSMILLLSLSASLITGCGSSSGRSSGDEGDEARDAFIITVKTDNRGDSSYNEFRIPTTGSGYDYSVDCDNDGVAEDVNQTGDYTCSYPAEGNYTIAITGVFPRIYFNDSGDSEKLLSVRQWGTGKWDSMNAAFEGCSNLDGNATDAPDLSQVTDMGSMFYNAGAFNAAIGDWNVSHVTSMEHMFGYAGSFNGDIGGWDVSSVTDMSGMFFRAGSFNGDIGDWNVSRVTRMNYMFADAGAFNGNIENWDVGSVTRMSFMFAGAAAFSDHNLSGWDVGKVIYHTSFSSGWGSGNSEPIWP